MIASRQLKLFDPAQEGPLAFCGDGCNTTVPELDCKFGVILEL